MAKMGRFQPAHFYPLVSFLQLVRRRGLINKPASSLNCSLIPLSSFFIHSRASSACEPEASGSADLLPPAEVASPPSESQPVAAAISKPGTMTSDSFFDAQARIFASIKAAPHLQDIAAKKLLEVAAELEKADGSAPAAAPKSAPFQVDFNNPFADLKVGFHKFKAEKWGKEPERYEPLKKGQWPKFMIVTCVDSRVSPATILGLEPGEAFVLRNVANLVPPYEKGGYPSAGCAIEYAVKHLKVEHLLINGHHSCGGIGNLVHTQGGKTNCNHLFVESWTNIAADAFEKLEAELKDAPADEKLRFAEKEAVNVSLRNLLTYPFVTEAVEAGKLNLFGSFYDFVNGNFEYWTFVDGKPGPKQLL